MTPRSPRHGGSLVRTSRSSPRRETCCCHRSCRYHAGWWRRGTAARSAAVGERPGDRAGVELHEPQLAGEIASVPGEVEPGSVRDLLATMGEGSVAVVEHIEMTDHRTEPATVAGRGDDGVGLDA